MITSLSDSSSPLRPTPALPIDDDEMSCWDEVVAGPGPLWLAAGGGVGLGDASRVDSTAGATLSMLLVLLMELWWWCVEISGPAG
jgi:hypothetical protein